MKIKKILALILAVSTVFCSCASNETEPPEETVSEATVETTSATTETTTETTTEQTTVTTTVTTTETTTEETTVAEPESPWALKFYVDDFGREIEGLGFIRGVFDGTFSNSVTTNAELTVLIDAELYCNNNKENWDMLDMKLYEYGSSKVTNPLSSSKAYEIMVLDLQIKIKPQTGKFTKN